METIDKGTQHSTSTPEMFAQQWPHLRQQVKNWWSQLTEADLDQVAGNKEQLVRTLQGRYGYPRERAEQEVERRLSSASEASMDSRIGRMTETATSSAQELASEATKTAGEVGIKAQKMAATAASAVSDTVTRAGQYLPEVPSGLAGLIRRYPVPSLMLGMGLGFLLGRSLGWASEGEGENESRQRREAGYPDALIQCSRCGQMIRQVDMVHHSATCTGSATPTTGGSTS
jgi:uncharacterized protein YjbJ (UPF0337 family)